MTILMKNKVLMRVNNCIARGKKIIEGLFPEVEMLPEKWMLL
jgi:hypothetical protein